MMECMMAVLDVLVGSNEYLECQEVGIWVGFVRGSNKAGI